MKTILLVYEDNSLAKLLGLQIKKLGFELEYMDREQLSVSELIKAGYALIVMEIMAGNHNSLKSSEIVRNIREEEALSGVSRVPIIVLSPKNQSEAELLSAGADESFKKPLPFKTLARAIKQWCS